MNELDKKIQEALRKEDAELFEEFVGEPSVYEMIMETFRGRHGWMKVLGVFWGVVFTVLAVLAAVQVFRAEETRDVLMWALACGVCCLAIIMIKIWYWIELNKNAVTREIKRLELQIARLAGRLKNTEQGG